MWELIGSVLGIVDKFIPDATQAAKLKEALVQLMTNAIQAQSQVVMAEAQGESWLQRNWRPLLMVEFMVVIFNNLIVVTYIPHSHAIPMPPQIWNLLEIGVGGYVVGRSLEKAVKNWKS